MTAAATIYHRRNCIRENIIYHKPYTSIKRNAVRYISINYKVYDTCAFDFDGCKNVSKNSKHNTSCNKIATTL